MPTVAIDPATAHAVLQLHNHNDASAAAKRLVVPKQNGFPFGMTSSHENNTMWVGLQPAVASVAL
ncbi:MAG: hypothetical protein AB7I19_09390 [Planctomycetota bacterium]